MGSVKPGANTTTVRPAICKHPLWPKLWPLLIVEAGTTLATGKKHRRFEMPCTGLPVAAVQAMRDMRVACAACGSEIAPLRHRKGNNAGRADRPGRLFLALTCPLDVRVGCSRGHAASDAYAGVVSDIASRRKVRQAEQLTLKLFGGKGG